MSVRTQEQLINVGKLLQSKVVHLSKIVNDWFRTRSTGPKALIILLPLVLAFLVVISPFPEGSSLNNDWNGLSIAANTVRQHGYQVTQIYNTPLELSTSRLPGILVIHHVTRPYTAEEVTHLLELAKNGWGIFIAEEVNSELTRTFNVRINSFYIREEKSFVDDPTQPLIAPTPTMNVSGELNIFLSKVRPMDVSGMSVSVEPILTTSSESWLDVDANGLYDQQVDELGPFIVGIRFNYGQGRIVLMSDHTWLQNQLMSQHDNAAFFMAILDWLGEGISNTMGTRPMVYFDESHLKWTTFKPQLFLHALSQAQSLLLQNMLVIFLYFIIVSPIIFYQFSTLVNRQVELHARMLKEVKGESIFLEKKHRFLEAVRNPVTRFEIMYYKVLLKWLSLDPYFNINWIINDPALERVETLSFLDHYLTRLYQVNKEDIESTSRFGFKTLPELKEKTHDLFKSAYRHEVLGTNALSKNKYHELSVFCYHLTFLVSKDKKTLI